MPVQSLSLRRRVMKTHGRLLAVSVLLSIHLISRSVLADVKLVTSRRNSTLNFNPKNVILEEVIITRNGSDTEIFEHAISPSTINSEILSLLDDRENTRGSNAESDQNAAQSEMIVIDANDTDDTKNLEHALSVVGYESQKIRTKDKRKVLESSNDFIDSPETSNEDTVSRTPKFEEIYYEVPRNVQVKKDYNDGATAARAEFDTRPVIKNFASQDSTPPSIFVPVKRRKFSRNREQENLPPLIALQGTGFQSVASTSTTLPSYRSSHSRFPVDSKREKYLIEETITTTPSSSISYTTKPMKRKKNRKTVVEASTKKSPPRSRRVNNEKFNIEIPGRKVVPRSNPSNIASRNEASHFGLLAKYDVAPRPFSFRSRSPSVNSETTTEKPKTNDNRQSTLRSAATRNLDSYTSSPTRRRNDEFASSRIIDSTVPNPYAKRDAGRDFESTRYHTKETTPSRSEEIEDERIEESTESIEIVREGSIPRFSEYSMKDELDPSVDPRLERRVSSQDRGIYQKNPNLSRTELTNPGLVTESPYATLKPYSARFKTHSGLLSTLAPLEYYSSGTTDSRVPQNLANSKLEVTSEEVADSKSVEDKGEEEESDLESGRYEIHETPDEGLSSKKHENQRDQRYENYNSGERYEKSDEQSKYKTDVKKDYKNSRENHSEFDYDEIPLKYQSKKFEDQNESKIKHVDSMDSIEEDHNKNKMENDAVAENSDHSEKQKDDGGEEKYEKGESMERGEEHHQSNGEKGSKGYKNWHENDKSNKGHHDKERHNNYYDEKEGEEKKTDEEGEYHEDHQEGEKGKKEAEFGEKGEHQKGHSTKGEHSVHKKDEFEKKTEFFDEFHEEGEMEKDGGYHEEHELAKGGHEKSSHHEEKDHEGKYGKEGKHEKGRHYHQNEGHEIGEGQDSHYDRMGAHGKKGSHEGGEKWTYEDVAAPSAKQESDHH